MSLIDIAPINNQGDINTNADNNNDIHSQDCNSNNNNTVASSKATENKADAGNASKENTNDKINSNLNNQAPVVKPPGVPSNIDIPAALAPFLDDLLENQDTEGKRVFVANKTGEKYTETESLGEGTFKVVDRLGDVFVIKAPKETASVDMITKEIEFLEKVRGYRNVIEHFGVVHDSSGMYLRQELCLPRNLSVLMANRKFLTDPEVRFYAKQLVLGLRAIHRHDIIHRDLNPGNILVGEGMVLKIANFGSAISRSEKNVTGFVGTVGFVAPEVVKMKEHTTAMDVFSLGIIFYMMFNCKKPRITDETGVHPPPGKFYKKIRGCKEAKDFIKMALKIEIKERALLLDLAMHDFIKEGYCPDSLPDTVFDTAPIFINENKRKADDGKEQEDEDEGTKNEKVSNKDDGGKEVKRARLDDLTRIELYQRKLNNHKAEKRELKEWWKETQDRLKEEENRLRAKYGPDIDLNDKPLEEPPF
ncbi:Serine/threonine-protein kinase plk2 [Mortierella sp. AD031]|nr:Serine/threonine-protein kinase plk2 [Mortierella sp. AD031]KAG0217226.1 Serine/threonine-protein kinase plk2 [Mortierella sp. NVP41]